MKTLLIAVLSAAGLLAQGVDSSPRAPAAFTVATLPAAASWTNKVALVTDGSAAGDCTTGSGSTLVLCASNGSAWASVGGGGGSSTYTRSDFLPVASCTGNAGTPYLNSGIAGINGATPSTFGGCPGDAGAGDVLAGYISFSASANTAFAMLWHVPTGFSALVSVTYHWSNDTATKTNAFIYGAYCLSSTRPWFAAAPTWTDDAAFTDTSNSTTFTVTNTVHATTNVDSCTAGNLLYLHIERNGTNASDNGGVMYLLGITLRYTVTLP